MIVFAVLQEPRLLIQTFGFQSGQLSLGDVVNGQRSIKFFLSLSFLCDTADGRVSFYARDLESARELAANMRAFEPRLPERVSQSVDVLESDR